MDEQNRQLSSKQKKSLWKTFLISAAATLGVCIILIGGSIWSYYNFIYDGQAQVSSDELGGEDDTEGTAKEERNNINQTLAVFGVDGDGTRTDVIFVVNFNSQTNKVKVVSLPRDTKVEWSEEQRARLKADKGYTIYTSKLNEMSAYGGMSNKGGTSAVKDYTIDEIQKILGIKVDNYVVINLEAFRKIVDTIGGVEVDVPQNMYYQDPYQDLYIDLKKGVQTLDGKKAEQLVRFRSYPDGDEGRIKVQQLFLESFAEKILSPQTITKVPQFVTILFTYLKTDVSLTQIANYYPFLQSFNVENLSFHTLPGEGRYQNSVSYFFVDNQLLPEFIEDIFYDREVVEEQSVTTTSNLGVAGGETKSEEEREPLIDYNVTIEVLNAAGKNGLAGRVKDTLEKQSYSVKKIGNYDGDNREDTVIYAKDSKKGEQFKTYFKDATVISSSLIETDIRIIVGKDYTH